MNIDLLRDILLAVRASGHEFTLTGYPEKEVHQAADYLRRKGYISAVMRVSPNARFPLVLPRGLTEEGEELAAAIENDLVWIHVKQLLSRLEDRIDLIVIQRVAEKAHRMRN